MIRLENGRTDPEKCQFATAIQIIEIFFPSIQIQDFYTHWDTGDLDVMLVKRKSTVAQRASKRGFFSDENGELE